MEITIYGLTAEEVLNDYIEKHSGKKVNHLFYCSQRKLYGIMFENE